MQILFVVEKVVEAQRWDQFRQVSCHHKQNIILSVNSVEITIADWANLSHLTADELLTEDTAFSDS